MEEEEDEERKNTVSTQKLSATEAETSLSSWRGSDPFLPIEAHFLLPDKHFLNMAKVILFSNPIG